MDPITTAIVAAVIAGVTEATATVAQTAIVDAYNVLKSTLKSKFGSDSKVSEAVQEVEEEPDFEPNQSALAGRIAQTKADQDPDLQKLAQDLLDALQNTPEGRAAVSKYQVDARGAQIGVLGDQAKIKGGITFGEKPKPE